MAVNLWASDGFLLLNGIWLHKWYIWDIPVGTMERLVVCFVEPGAARVRDATQSHQSVRKGVRHRNLSCRPPRAAKFCTGALLVLGSVTLE
jgi:hypothetical protein